MQIYIKIAFFQLFSHFLFTFRSISTSQKTKQFSIIRSFISKYREEVLTLLGFNTLAMDNTAIKVISYFDDIEEFLIGVLFFTLPFGWSFSIIPLVLFSTTLAINIFTKPQRPNKEKLLYFAPLMMIFVWNAITLIYSDNAKHGFDILATQAILIVASLAFLFNNIKATTVTKAFHLFIAGCITAVIALFGIAIYNSSAIIGDAFVFRPFFESQDNCLLDGDINNNYFLGAQFSAFVHPAYMALMLSIAMFIILHDIRMDVRNLKHKGLSLLAFTLLGLSIISFSLNGTLVLSVVICLLVAGIMSLRNIHYADYTRVIYSIVFTFLLFIIVNPQVQQVVNQSSSCNSLAQRITITQTSLETIGQHLLTGVGIGDADQTLVDNYTAGHHTHLADRGLNSHNQFLTTWIQSGIIGILILGWAFVTIAIRAIRKRMILLHVFNILIFFSFLFESMLMRYWGVLTYTLFYSILFFYSEEKIKPKHTR